ncbi:MAG: response regulator [Ignavibacteria bacterium]|jgi:signal transduction histidine kinase|nr:response regulator [Ignavibacteria bacterium]
MDQTNFKILVVEDEEPIRELLKMELENEGFIVDVAANGAEGLDKVKSFKPDLIVCDVMMPVMDGFTMAERLSQDSRYKDIPLIFLTAKSDKKDIRFGKSLGAEDYITKPFEFEDLLVSINAKLKKYVERKRILNERLDEIRKSILYALPHEFKNPLSTMNGFLSLLLDKGYEKSEEEQEEFLKYIKQSSDRLYRLVMNFLKIAELEIIETDENKIKEIRSIRNQNWKTELETILNDLSQKFNHKINYTFEGVNLPCPFDYNTLNIILTELVSNAIKFSPEDRVDVFVYAKATPTFFELSVEDKGRGIPEEEIERIVELFYQYNRKYYEQQGGGLGLTIVNKLVDIFNGKLTIESKVDVGTKVKIFVPLE